MLCWRNTKKSKKVFIWGIIAIIFGVLLVLTAIIFPIVIHKALSDEIPSSVALSKENEDDWNALPGKHNLEVIKEVYLYNWTNPEEVRELILNWINCFRLCGLGNALSLFNLTLFPTLTGRSTMKSTTPESKFLGIQSKMRG